MGTHVHPVNEALGKAEHEDVVARREEMRERRELAAEIGRVRREEEEVDRGGVEKVEYVPGRSSLPTGMAKVAEAVHSAMQARAKAKRKR
jgi:hypothetical protein